MMMKNRIIKMGLKVKDIAYEHSKIFYRFAPEKYPKTFLNRKIDTPEFGHKIDRVVYCFWTGDNELTENRKKNLVAMEQITGVRVQLVTKKNLADYILPDFPFHEAYEYLSAIHKSDYLRAYFMHHYGGGYCDIKKPTHSWIRNFEKAEKNKKIWIVGYREVNGLGVCLPQNKVIKEDYEKLFYDMRKNFRYLIGSGAYIMKKRTPFTYEWMYRLHEILDRDLEILKKNPGNLLGTNNDYPYVNYKNDYFAILGQIIVPLFLKYHSHVLPSPEMQISYKDYK